MVLSENDGELSRDRIAQSDDGFRPNGIYFGAKGGAFKLAAWAIAPVSPPFRNRG